MSVPISYFQLAAVDTSNAELNYCFVLINDKSKRFLESLIMWIVQSIYEFDANYLQCTIASVAALFVESKMCISKKIVISENQGESNMLLVLPHHLININIRSLLCVINAHRSHIERRFSSNDIYQITSDIVQLKHAYCEEPLFNIVIYSSTNLLYFESFCSVTCGQFKSLVVF